MPSGAGSKEAISLLAVSRVFKLTAFMTKVYSLSLGCPKNRVDTEHALGFIARFGTLAVVETPEEADCIFVNTCGFIAPAVEESVRAVVELVDDISGMQAERRPLLVVAGCLVGRYGKEALAPDLPEVDLFLDNRELGQWGLLLELALEHRKGGQSGIALGGERSLKGGRSFDNDEVSLEGELSLGTGTARRDGKAMSGGGLAQTPAGALFTEISAGQVPAYMHGHRLLSTGPSYAWLKISDGCRHACSFCTIPGIRGPLRSIPAEVLADEAALLLDAGVRELILVAQDLTAWGKDLGEEQGLIRLLEKLLPLPGLDRLRLMYLYPAGIRKDLLDFLKQAGPPFVPYFDVPLQHAAAPVLSRMGRPFVGRPGEVVERIRSVFPKAALRTSIIVGFPGETDDDFAELLNFVRESRFMHLGVFAYEAEEGTVAATMPNQVDDAIKQERRDILMQAQAEISGELLEDFVGQRMDILVDTPQGEWPGLHVGRTWFQAPDIDGITYVSGPGVMPGALVEAEIVEASEYDLTALG